MKELNPKSVMSRIRRNKDKQIYFLPSTASMMRSNIYCDELKRYRFLVGFTDVEYKGEICCLGKVRTILEEKEKTADGYETWYEAPKKPNGMLVI